MYDRAVLRHHALHGPDRLPAGSSALAERVDVSADGLLLVDVGQERAGVGKNPDRDPEELEEGAAHLREGFAIDDLLEAADVAHAEIDAAHRDTPS